jgi:hypothetical protein
MFADDRRLRSVGHRGVKLWVYINLHRKGAAVIGVVFIVHVKFQTTSFVCRKLLYRIIMHPTFGRR